MSDHLRLYIRTAIRGLLRAPGFTAIAAFTIALGIGAAAAIFSLVDAAFIHPLPYPAANRLVAIATTRKGDEISDSYPDFLDWRARNHTFKDIAAFDGSNVSLTGGSGDAERIRGQLITPNLFRTLGVPVARGRDFVDTESDWGAPRVVILSDGLWKRRFGGDPAAVGRTITLERQPYEVVGVMPAGFDFPGGIVYGPAELWIPLGAGADKADWMNRGSHPGLEAIGRLRDGISAETAQKDLDAVAAEMRAENPDDDKDIGVRLRGALASIVGDLVPGLSLVGAAALLLLLITSANVAGLLLARSVARHREVAIRTALGATRANVVMQLLVESTLLGLIGGTVGVAFAWAAVRAVRPLLGGIPRAGDAHIDWRVIAFAVVLSAVTSVLFGIGPALAATGRRIESWLGERGHTGATGGARLRRLLVGGEIAVALVLVISAAMLGRSFINMTRDKGGIEADGVLTFELRLPASAYADGPPVVAFFSELSGRLAALPGAKVAGGISTLPFSGAGSQSGMQPVQGGIEPVRTDVAAVTPDYFRAMGVQLVAGRGVLASDDASSPPVAVIDDRFARRFWKNETDAIGKEISGWGFHALTVVGVVRHVKNYGVTAESRQELFVPHAQRASTRMILALRTNGDAAALSRSVREAVGAMDAQLPVYNLRTMRDVVAGTISAPRLATNLSGALAGLALMLAAVGLYGVLAFTVGQRTREIGVRMALGATASGVLRMVLRDAALLAFAGIGAGVAMAFGAVALLKSQLFGVAPVDPVIFASVPVVFVGVAMLASTVPALRAARVSPMEALRGE